MEDCSEFFLLIIFVRLISVFCFTVSQGADGVRGLKGSKGEKVE